MPDIKPLPTVTHVATLSIDDADDGRFMVRIEDPSDGERGCLDGFYNTQGQALDAGIAWAADRGLVLSTAGIGFRCLHGSFPKGPS